MASGRVLLRVSGLPAWFTLMRAPEIPCVRWRRRSAIAPALSLRLSQSLSGMIDHAGIDLGGAAEAARADVHAQRIAALDLVHGDRLDLAQLPVEILDARAFRRGDEDAHESAIFLRCELGGQAQSRERNPEHEHHAATRQTSPANHRRSTAAACPTSRVRSPAA